MTIRKAVADDHDTLVDIWLRSVKATHIFLTEQDIHALLPEVRNGALIKLEWWVLCSDERAIGFLGLSGSKVEALFISPESLRLGGGRMLLNHARRLKGVLTADVNEQNAEAVRFYEACGFTVTGRSPVDSSGRPFPLVHMHDKQA